MKKYIATPDVLEYTQNDSLNLANSDDVFGYSIHVPSNSLNNATVKINGSPNLEVIAGDPPIPFGGFAVGDIPVQYRDEIKISFDSTNPATPGVQNRLIIIVTRLNCNK